MRLTVARIGKAHGIRGEVTIELRTDEPGLRFTPGAEFFVTGLAPGGPTTLRLEAVRDHNGVLLLAFEDVLDRTEAEALRGGVLEAEIDTEAEADPEEDDAWYDHQLLGLRAEAPDGSDLGVIVRVEHLPAQDLLTLKRPDGERRLVPFVRAIVPVVDVAGGRMVVDAPPGLLEDLQD